MLSVKELHTGNIKKLNLRITELLGNAELPHSVAKTVGDLLTYKPPNLN